MCLILYLFILCTREFDTPLQLPLSYLLESPSFWLRGFPLVSQTWIPIKPGFWDIMTLWPRKHIFCPSNIFMLLHGVPRRRTCLKSNIFSPNFRVIFPLLCALRTEIAFFLCYVILPGLPGLPGILRNTNLESISKVTYY